MKIYLLVFGCLGLTACIKTGYHVEDGQVVRYGGLGAGKRVVSGADPKHFKALSDTYGKDRQHVFLRDEALADADPRTFELLSWGYTRDKSRVWWDKRVVTQDAAAFRIIPNPGDPTAIIYGRDSKHVYMREEKLKDADPETFEFVPMFNGYDLTRDNRHVWPSGSPQPLQDVDGFTFQKLGDTSFRDARQVWGLAFGTTTKWVKTPQVMKETGLKPPTP